MVSEIIPWLTLQTLEIHQYYVHAQCVPESVQARLTSGNDGLTQPWCGQFLTTVPFKVTLTIFCQAWDPIKLFRMYWHFPGEIHSEAWGSHNGREKCAPHVLSGHFSWGGCWVCGRTTALFFFMVTVLPELRSVFSLLLLHFFLSTYLTLIHGQW